MHPLNLPCQMRFEPRDHLNAARFFHLMAAADGCAWRARRRRRRQSWPRRLGSRRIPPLPSDLFGRRLVDLLAAWAASARNGVHGESVCQHRREAMKNLVASVFTLGAMLAGGLSTPVHAQASSTPPAAFPTAQPSAAQRLVGDIAPKLAELTDNVLFGDVWARPGLSPRDRSLVTVSALVAMNRPDQLRSHLARARANGVTQEEAVEVITHLAFYAGWPSAVTAVGVAREVYGQR